MDQRSPEWFQARLGKWTASSFAALMAGTATDAFCNLVKDKAWERLTGRPADSFTTPAMQHGIDTEQEAREWYEFETGRIVRLVGFIDHPEVPMFGCSPDGLLDDRMLEIKAPQPRAHLETMTTKRLSSKYRWQVQGQMLICGYKRLDFVSYHPATGGIIVPVEYCEKDGQALIERVAYAEAEVAELMRKAA
jgi:exodeoxyribonuclease (lambda-induced)